MAENNNQNAVNPVQIQKFLHVDYPADLNQLIEAARNQGAPEDVIAILQRLPQRTYNGPNAVSEEIGKLM
jgi:hypothetical protein